MAEATPPPRPADSLGDGGNPGSGDGGPDSSSTAAARPTRSPVNWPVFLGTAVIIVGFVLFAGIWPDTAADVIFGSMAWVATNFGWYYVLTAAIVVVFVLIVAFSKVGGTKMGPDHSLPKYNMFTWAAMLFAAGIGVDLMFFGISGPATNLLTPPDVPAGSAEAARMATIWTIFHYGIPGWAMYALMGMAFGLFAYRYHLPLSIRSALAPIFGKRIHGPIGHVAEIGATIGTIFGISVSLGIGVVFLNFGLSALFGIPNSVAVQIALMGLAVLITILSTVSGVDKGIRRLSELNVLLALVLMLWVLFSGNTHQLLNSLVQNIGDFFSQFPSMLMNTFAYSDGTADYPADQWMADWTLFFWAWWIAWAPFVSLFLARISRGRTLRQFVVGVLLIPFSFILLWVSIFGNAALSFFDDETFLDLAVNQPESGFFNLLEQYPGSTFTVTLALLTGLFFYTTSADSGSLVMANMTSKTTTADSDGPPWLRIVWAVITGALTLVMLFINGVYTLQAATVMVGLPLSVMLYLVMFSLWKVLKTESISLESRQATLPGLLTSRVREAGGGERGSWRTRLQHRMSYASAEQARTFIDTVATPAVEEVAEELRTLGADVACQRGAHPDSALPFVDLVVSFPEGEDFKYQTYPVAYSTPSFAANLAAVRETYYRVEIFSSLGSRGHDIMGYSQEQVIADLLDSYDAHIMYLTLSSEIGTATGAVPVTAPNTWADTDHIHRPAGSAPTQHEPAATTDPKERHD
ncbi:choline BCCT transporter BetT [Brachybacterium vulturis]|uniref:choline BCCT transporter BetT n=1 Tax=Brachybacterium vulturis TaxID=2017484 RepID=UPI003735B073